MTAVFLIFGYDSILNFRIRRIIEFSSLILYNSSTVSLCATKVAVWVYSHAVFLQKGANVYAD